MASAHTWSLNGNEPLPQRYNFAIQNGIQGGRTQFSPHLIYRTGHWDKQALAVHSHSRQPEEFTVDQTRILLHIYILDFGLLTWLEKKIWAICRVCVWFLYMWPMASSDAASYAKGLCSVLCCVLLIHAVGLLYSFVSRIISGGPHNINMYYMCILSNVVGLNQTIFSFVWPLVFVADKYQIGWRVCVRINIHRWSKSDTYLSWAARSIVFESLNVDSQVSLAVQPWHIEYYLIVKCTMFAQVEWMLSILQNRLLYYMGTAIPLSLTRTRPTLMRAQIVAEVHNAQSGTARLCVLFSLDP